LLLPPRRRRLSCRGRARRSTPPPPAPSACSPTLKPTSEVHADGSSGHRTPSPRTSMDRQVDAEAAASASGQAPDVKPPPDEVHAPVIAVESTAASCV
uniref:Uncharacterized protein n=1 Tax=Aegilops tauschii subsp. strangulata TaxID=200361 RepID=A0A453BEU3_AEGTS